MGLSAVQTQFFSLNRQGMRGKDKVDYCVSLQIEHVTVLKKTSLTMSFLLSTEQNLQPQELKHYRQAPFSNCSISKVKTCYLLV